LGFCVFDYLHELLMYKLLPTILPTEQPLHMSFSLKKLVVIYQTRYKNCEWLHCITPPFVLSCNVAT